MLPAAPQPIALEVSQLSKSFRLPSEQANGIKQAVVNLTKGIKGYTQQMVLSDISFTVNQGDFFGIVGRNGSGKSTLLKLISDIYTADSGTVSINGTLVSFIELGVGFNAELTGRENVYLNGALMGFSAAEIDTMYAEIVDFAELHEFMGQKLKNYSSGMQVRLAFSCAIQANSDILVLDEVLAVGDEAFQRKCNDYFSQMQKNKAKTIILVTHSMAAVRQFCNKAMMLRNGQVVVCGAPEDVANEYSLENLKYTKPTGMDDKAEESIIQDFAVKLLSAQQIDQYGSIDVQVSFKATKTTTCFIAAVLQDIDRNIPLIIRDSDLQNVSARDAVCLTASFTVPAVNDANIKILINVRDATRGVIAYYPDYLAPIVALRRTDYPAHRITDSVLYDYKEWQ